MSTNQTFTLEEGGKSYKYQLTAMKILNHISTHKIIQEPSNRKHISVEKLEINLKTSR